MSKSRTPAGVVRIAPQLQQALKRMSAENHISIQDYVTAVVKQALVEDFGADQVRRWTAEKGDPQHAALQRLQMQSDPD